MSVTNSTIAFKSNLQVITEDRISDDKRFLEYIRDFKGLEYMKKNVFLLNSIQKDEYERAALHCIYAFPDDYPNGTVITEDGKEVVVCKCINTACNYFSQCRPDFNQKEITVLEENKVVQDIIAGAEERAKAGNLQDKKQVGDEKAALKLFEMPIEKKEKSDNIMSNTGGKKEQKKSREKISKIKIVPANFESFVTVEQNEIITMSPIERTIVNAGPGTGKTWTLIEKIRYMLNDLDMDPESILVLCFSRAAVEVVRTRLNDAAEQGMLRLNWRMVDVRTFDSFCTYIIFWIKENHPELLPENYSIENEDYDARIKTASKILEQYPDTMALFEHVIIDEVQDLVGSRAEFVLTLLKILPNACGFTLLGDSCQAIYDYVAENDSTVMSSMEFYNFLFKRFNTANYYTIEKNYRQDEELEEIVAPYREAILSKQAKNRLRAVKNLYRSISETKFNLNHFGMIEAYKYVKKGTLGILTRTNAQALQISTWLRNEGVVHKLEQPISDTEPAGWIGKILCCAKTDIIDRKEFTNIFNSLYPQNFFDANQYWNALVSTQTNQGKNHYEIEDILRGIMQNGKNPLLYENPLTDLPSITVSNIHRAKGREFDSVIVLSEIFSEIIENDNDDDLEHRICYVAATRSRKKLEIAPWKTQYIRIMKDKERKCFKSGGYSSRKYLSHYEIGAVTDFDPRFFASSENLQNFLRENLEPGTRLKLIKQPKDSHTYICYKLVLEDDEKETIAVTTPQFAVGMEKAIQKIYENYSSIGYKYFPNVFSDIYVEGLTTCISAHGNDIPGALKFGEMYLWTGVSVSGFAQMEKDTY